MVIIAIIVCEMPTSYTINTFQMKADLFLNIISYMWCLHLCLHDLSNLKSSTSKEISLHHLLNIHFLFPVHTDTHSGTNSKPDRVILKALRLHYSEERSEELSKYSLSLSIFILFSIRMSCNYQTECALNVDFGPSPPPLR